MAASHRIDWFFVARVALLGVVTLFLILAAARVFSADATVSWAHPTQRTDNTALPLAEIRETDVEWGLCAAGGVFPATPAGMKVVPAPAATTVITGLGYGLWCFRARTTDITGAESVNSLTVNKQYLAPPKPPVLSATITVVYEIASHPVDGIRLAREVGTIPMGAECVNNPIDTDRGEYYEVSLDKVTLSKMPKSAIVVTKCAWSG
jgi:hypothetical protein